ncbi:MAG: response regulator [Bacteroidales bacterium]|nr:response regulator [Bacteroidales bacterium]
MKIVLYSIMNLNILKVLIFALLLHCCSIAWADGGIRLRHINTKGGEVHTVYGGEDGIVWLGMSSGLYSLPQLESSNPEGYSRSVTCSNLMINMISSDSKGRLWIRNNASTVSVYDPQSNHFEPYAGQLLRAKGINVSNECVVLADGKGSLWAMDGGQLYWYSEDNQDVTSYDVAPEGLLLDIHYNSQKLAVLSDSDICVFSIATRKLAGKIPLPDHLNDVQNFIMNEDGKIWIWQREALYCYNPKKNYWQSLGNMPSSITGVAEDGKGCLWVATRASGIYVYDCDSYKNKISLQHSAWDANSLLSNQVEMLYYNPKSQTIWIGYRKGGLSECSSSDCYWTSVIPDSTRQDADTDVLTFAPCNDGDGMWVGLEKRGVYLWAHGRATPIVRGGSVTALYADADGSLWAGLYQQGLLHRSADGKETWYFEGESPYSIVKDSSKNVYVALLSKGVWKIDSNGAVSDIGNGLKFIFDLQWKSGSLIAATSEGLWTTDFRNGWQKKLDGNYRDISIYQSRLILLAGGEGNEGITVLDSNYRTLEIPSELKKTSAKSISPDCNGNIWIATSSALVMLRPDSTQYGGWRRCSFDYNLDGKQFFFNNGAGIVDHDYILWMGTTAGFLRADTRRLVAQTADTTQECRLVLGSISINDNIISPSLPYNGRILLDGDVMYARSLSLHYDENNIVIECCKPCDGNTNAGKYYYRVEGLSDAWHAVDNNSIVLSNMHWGDYKVWTRSEFSRANMLIAIHISSPWWRTWWAYLVYAFVVASVAGVVIRYIAHKREYQYKIRELQMQREREAQLNDMKMNFFTNISHDLRTPLTLIINPLNDLVSSTDNPDTAATLQIMQRNANQLLSLVNQTLDLRRLEYGQEQLALAYGDIVALAGGICHNFGKQAEIQKIDFKMEPSAPHIFTMFDSDKTSKILMNLLSNAFKFTAAGGSIVVTISNKESDISISVADTGSGIPDSEKSKIFERFYQTESGNRASGGSGVGLHIVREYVRMQGGDISVTDNPQGQGTVFSFTIPVKAQDIIIEDNNNSQNAAPSTDENMEDENPMPRKTSVMVIDDNADMLAYVGKALSGEYDVATASNADEAFDMLQNDDYDIIISDVMMPGTDGMEFCRRIKGDIRTSHIPVILLTAKALTSDELQGLESGADDYITKPFSVQILIQRVHNIVERSRLLHERFAKGVDIEPSDITVTSVDQQFIAQAIAIVEQNIGDSTFSIEQLSSELGMHRAQLYRKLMHITGKTPQQFVRILRLKRGRQLLQQSGMYVSEVAYKVGFNSPRIFSKYFKEEFGVTPKEASK